MTDAYVTPTQLQTLTGNLHLQATRNLTVASSFTYANGNATLEAGNNLTVNAAAAISITGGSLTLTAASGAIPGANSAGALTSREASPHPLGLSR